MNPNPAILERPSVAAFITALSSLPLENTAILQVSWSEGIKIPLNKKEMI